MEDWKKAFKMRKNYSSNFPFCFYNLAEKYLPENKNAIIIDIGCGKCKFENYLSLWKRYVNLMVLDGNQYIISELKQKYNHSQVLRYNAPNKLPFIDKSVDYIFCSHLIEHLYFNELYRLFKEFNRVLKINGILIVSSPMLWNNFYDTFNHIKPYHPNIFKAYFYSKINVSFYTPISKTYKLEKLVYRYHTFIDVHNTTGSSIKVIDFLIQISKYILKKLGIKKYTQTGYTIILRKQ